MRVRPFVAADQAAARQLVLEGLGEHFGFVDERLNPDLKDIQRNYVEAGSIFVVAEEAGEIIGTGALVPDGERVRRIVRVSVSPQHRRKGVGKAIVTYLMMRATYWGDQALLVETNRDWEDAIHLYLTMGFVEYARDSVSIHMQMNL